MKPRRMWILVVACAAAAGCAPPRTASAADRSRRIEAVSRTEPRLEPLARPAPPTVNAAPVPSLGTCAPRYAIGLRGTCINERPCRGFGVVGERGQPVCTCYARVGGCSQGERCDTIKKGCVPEGEPGYGRAPDD